MRVFATVSENQIRGQLLQFLFKDGFHLAARVWHESILKCLQRHALQTRTGKQFSCASRFGLAHSNRTKDSPVEHAGWILLSQTQDRAATAYFDIVGVRAETKNRWRF